MKGGVIPKRYVWGGGQEKRTTKVKGEVYEKDGENTQRPAGTLPRRGHEGQQGGGNRSQILRQIIGEKDGAGRPNTNIGTEGEILVFGTWIGQK